MWYGDLWTKRQKEQEKKRKKTIRLACNNILTYISFYTSLLLTYIILFTVQLLPAACTFIRLVRGLPLVHCDTWKPGVSSAVQRRIPVHFVTCTGGADVFLDTHTYPPSVF